MLALPFFKHTFLFIIPPSKESAASSQTGSPQAVHPKHIKHTLFEDDIDLERASASKSRCAPVEQAIENYLPEILKFQSEVAQSGTAAESTFVLWDGFANHFRF